MQTLATPGLEAVLTKLDEARRVDLEEEYFAEGQRTPVRDVLNVFSAAGRRCRLCIAGNHFRPLCIAGAHDHVPFITLRACRSYAKASRPGSGDPATNRPLL